jgi:TP901 family phage tail tape measure protein
MAGIGFREAIIAIRVMDLTGGGLNSISSKFASMGATMSQIGLGMTALITVPLAGIGTASAKAAIDYDKSMRNIQSISKVSDSVIQSLSERFMKMSTDLTKTTDTPQKLAEAYYEIQSAGFMGAEGEKVLAASTIAATAGLADTRDTAIAVTNALNAYGLGASSATHLTDVMVKGVDIGVFHFQDLTNEMGNWINAASMLKIPIEEAMAALTTMTKKGISMPEASTSLNRIFTSFLKPSPKAAGAAASIGIDLSAQTMSTLGFANSLKLVAERTGLYTIIQKSEKDARVADISAQIIQTQNNLRLAQSQKAPIAAIQNELAALQARKKEIKSQIFDQLDYNATVDEMTKTTGAQAGAIAAIFPEMRSMRGILALLDDDLVMYNSDLKQLGSSGGMSYATFGIQTQSFSAQLQNFKNNISVAAISLGQAFLPAVVNVTKALTPLIQAFIDLPLQVKQSIVVFGVIAMVLGPLLMVFGMIIQGIAGVVGAFFSLAALPFKLVAALSSGASVIGKAMGGITLPVIINTLLIAGAIALLVYMWKSNWGGMADSVKSFWASAQPELQKFVDFVMGTVIPATLNMASAVGHAFNQLGATIKGNRLEAMQEQLAGIQAAPFASDSIDKITQLKGAIRDITGQMDDYKNVVRVLSEPQTHTKEQLTSASIGKKRLEDQLKVSLGEQDSAKFFNQVTSGGFNIEALAQMQKNYEETFAKLRQAQESGVKVTQPYESTLSSLESQLKSTMGAAKFDEFKNRLVVLGPGIHSVNTELQDYVTTYKRITEIQSQAKPGLGVDTTALTSLNERASVLKKDLLKTLSPSDLSDIQNQISSNKLDLAPFQAKLASGTTVAANSAANKGTANGVATGITSGIASGINIALPASASALVDGIKNIIMSGVGELDRLFPGFKAAAQKFLAELGKVNSAVAVMGSLSPAKPSSLFGSIHTAFQGAGQGQGATGVGWTGTGNPDFKALQDQYAQAYTDLMNGVGGGIQDGTDQGAQYFDKATDQMASDLQSKIGSAISGGISASKGLGDLTGGTNGGGPNAPGANGGFENIFRLQDVAMNLGTSHEGKDTRKFYQQFFDGMGFDQAKEQASKVVKDFQLGIMSPDVMKFVDTDKLVDAAKMEKVAEASQKALSEAIAKKAGVSDDEVARLLGFKGKDAAGNDLVLDYTNIINGAANGMKSAVDANGTSFMSVGEAMAPWIQAGVDKGLKIPPVKVTKTPTPKVKAHNAKAPGLQAPMPYDGGGDGSEGDTGGYDLGASFLGNLSGYDMKSMLPLVQPFVDNVGMSMDAAAQVTSYNTFLQTLVGRASTQMLDLTGLFSNIMTTFDSALLANADNLFRRGSDVWNVVGRGIVDRAKKDGVLYAAVEAMVLAILGDQLA